MNSSKIILLGFVILLSSCKVYKQNIILETDNSINASAFMAEIALTEGAYIIQPYDKISLEIFTNQGERVIDPNLELVINGSGNNIRPSNVFQIFSNNTADLPLIGSINVQNETVQSLQKKLALLYADFYVEPYVRIKVINQRVIVLGALGGQVIPINNDNTTVLEVLAMAGGLTKDAKGGNIRIVRGPLDNPKVQVINLKSIEGMKMANLNVLPNDIIYIEPVRRVFNESIRDAAPLIGVITNVVTLLIVIQNLN